MAPAPRKSTGPSRTRKTGAASAVAAEPTENTVEVEEILEVDNAETHDASDAPATDIPAPTDVPVTDVDGDDAPEPGEPVAEDALAEPAPPARDLKVLAALADTSGRSAVTPYPGESAPTPVAVLPPLRDTHRWVREGDQGSTARVLVDGWRVRINGIPRFAAKGDRVTAPTDVIEAALSRGTLIAEPNQE